MKKKDDIWNERQARNFLGKRFRDKDTPTDKNGLPLILPKKIRTMDLSSLHVREALQAADEAKGGDMVLIMGPGGSGKSLVYKAIAHSLKKPLCLAPTGIAALNLVGDGWLDTGTRALGVPVPTTINRGLKIGVRPYFSVNDAKASVDLIYDKEYTAILVDEVSMVSPNLLDVLIAVARELDVPLVLFGDPMQLPPVERRDSGSPSWMYPGWRFFDSYGWMLQDMDHLRIIMLDSVYRQSDPGFKSLLNRARAGKLTEDDEKVLEGRITDTPPDDSLILCYRNDMAQKINAERAGSIRPKIHCSESYSGMVTEEMFRGRLEIEWSPEKPDEDDISSDIAVYLQPRTTDGPDVFEWDDEKVFNRPAKQLERDATVLKQLILYPGDRVMITRNMNVPEVNGDSDTVYSTLFNTGSSWSYPLDSKTGSTTSVVNGSMGTYLGRCNAFASYWSWQNVLPRRSAVSSNMHLYAISELHREDPEEGGHLVVQLDDGRLVLVPMCRFTTEVMNRRGDLYETEAVQQYPVRPAFAITYHKSQGLTLDAVHMILDENDQMPPGLGYLGISRCRTLEGLTFNRYVRNAFVCDASSAEFMEKVEEMIGEIDNEDVENASKLEVTYPEQEPYYMVPGQVVRFFSIYSAVMSTFVEMGRWSMEEKERYTLLSPEDIQTYCAPYGDSSDSIIKGSDAVADSWGLPYYRKKDNPDVEELLWNLCRQKLYCHPELRTFLLKAGDSEKSVIAFADLLTERCGIRDDYVSKFLGLCLPSPRGNILYPDYDRAGVVRR